MAEYLPFQGKHSIQEAQIGLLFHGPFDQRSIEETRAFSQAELSGELPRVAEGRGVAFQVDITDPAVPAMPQTMPSGVVGFRLARVKGDGQVARVLQLENSVLSVSFMDYESWETTRDDALKYLNSGLISLPLEQNPVVAFSLRFIDRYTFSGHPSDASAESLFMKNNPHITPNAFASGPLWHCNTGWFDNAIGGGRDRVLHNLNISSQPVDLSSATIVDHHSTIHLESPRQTRGALWNPADEEMGLKRALDILHDQNKDILRNILLPEMLSSIGLEP